MAATKDWKCVFKYLKFKLNKLPMLPNPKHSAEITLESQQAKIRGKQKQGYRKPIVV